MDLLGKHLKPPYIGPYKVIKFNDSKTAVHLEWTGSRTKVHKIQPVHRCRLYVPNTKQTRVDTEEQPPTIITEEGAVFDEIEKIVGHRKIRGTTQYLVKWLGFDSVHNTWEPIWHLVNEGCEESIEDYEANRLTAEPRKKRRKKH